MSELKPCPFCGNKPRIKNGTNSEDNPYFQVVHDCPNLWNMMETFCYATETAAIERWNHRTPNIDIPADRLQEICEAEAEDRLVVLPCKVGDTVYFAYSECEKISDAKVSGFWIADKWIQLQLANGSTFTCWDGPNKYFGKTVFLTEEEADAALKEAKE